MSRKRILWLALLAGLVVVLAAAGFAAQSSVSYANIATAYAAKQTCSCRHVSGRPLDSCLADYPADAREQITLIEDGESVHASAFYGLFTAEAHYEEGFGCGLVENQR